MPQPADDGGGSPEDKDHIIQELQLQLADEVTLRHDANARVEELGRQLSNMESEAETKYVCQQRDMQDRLIEKHREVCDLQHQLVEELAMRRQMQHMMIQKQETIHELQQKLDRLGPLLGLPQPPVHEEEEAADLATPQCPRIAEKCNGSGFGSPMPLGRRPHNLGMLSPQPVGSCFRRGYYTTQQQRQERKQHQGPPSIMDDCPMRVHAATFSCPQPPGRNDEARRFMPAQRGATFSCPQPGVFLRQDSGSRAPVFHGSFVSGSGPVGSCDRRGASFSSLSSSSSWRPACEMDCSITHRTASTFA